MTNATSYAGSTSGSDAIITETGINRTTSITVPNAASLATELSAFMSTPSQAAVEGSGYNLTPGDFGIDVETADGTMLIPYRWVSTVAAGV